jgi:6-phosphofructokinase 2
VLIVEEVGIAGSRVIVDTSGEALCAAARAGVYLLKPNMRELGQLAGRDIEGESAQESVARRLIEKGWAEVVVVSLGAAGALLVTADEVTRLRAPTVSIRSKIGAGDSMVAGIVLSLARGKAVQEAARFGVAAGSAAVMTPGTELCRREDTERLYERIAR